MKVLPTPIPHTAIASARGMGLVMKREVNEESQKANEGGDDPITADHRIREL